MSTGFIDRDDLFHPQNHVPHYPHSVVGAIDTMALRVLDWRGKDLYVTHYAAPVVKLQIVTTLRGHIAYYTGVHNGRMSDTRLAQLYTVPQLNLPWWARILGDGSYWGAANMFHAPLFRETYLGHDWDFFNVVLNVAIHLDNVRNKCRRWYADYPGRGHAGWDHRPPGV
eukprot:gene8555-1053_t